MTKKAIERISKKIDFKRTDTKEEVQKKLDSYLKLPSSQKLKKIIAENLFAQLSEKIVIGEKLKGKKVIVGQIKKGDATPKKPLFKIFQQTRKTRTGKIIKFTITIKRPRKAFTKEQDEFLRRNMIESNIHIAKAFKKQFKISKSKYAIRDRKARLMKKKK